MHGSSRIENTRCADRPISSDQSARVSLSPCSLRRDCRAVGTCTSGTPTGAGPSPAAARLRANISPWIAAYTFRATSSRKIVLASSHSAIFSFLLMLPRNLEQGRAWAHDAGKVHQGHERGEQRYSEYDGRAAGATDQLTQGHFDGISSAERKRPLVGAHRCPSPSGSDVTRQRRGRSKTMRAARTLARSLKPAGSA